MKQILVGTNPIFTKISGNSVELYPGIPAGQEVVFKGGKVTCLRVPFRVQVYTGGRFDLSFTVSKVLAENGISLLGAFQEDAEVVAYFSPVEGIDIVIDNGTPILVGTLIQLASYRQVDGTVTGSVVDLNDGKTMNLQPEPKKNNKRKSK